MLTDVVAVRIKPNIKEMKKLQSSNKSVRFRYSSIFFLFDWRKRRLYSLEIHGMENREPTGNAFWLDAIYAGNLLNGFKQTPSVYDCCKQNIRPPTERHTLFCPPRDTFIFPSRYFFSYVYTRTHIHNHVYIIFFHKCTANNIKMSVPKKNPTLEFLQGEI